MSDSTKIVLADGTTEYRNADGLLHRVDGPACIYSDGSQKWYKNGELHRDDGPSVILPNGYQEWHQNGRLHRVDGPALIFANGSQRWYKNGLDHREDGPAVIRVDGYKAWYKNGRIHREDGPAIEWFNGFKIWYLNGVEVTEQIVMRPETITLEQISEKKDVEVRSIMIERYGWLRYIQDSKAKLLDSRDNAIEKTKEALFAAGELGNRLVVTCPTGRVFALSVPSVIKTCEEAQQWLGNESNESNVIGRN